MTLRNAKDFQDRLQTRIDVRDAKRKNCALILLIAREMADDPNFGLTKLNKALWWIDFMSFSIRKKPVTGLRYQKLPNGPALRSLIPQLEEMEKNGQIARRTEPMSDPRYVRKVVIPRQTPDMRLFSDEEKSIIDFCIREIKGKTARQCSDESHGPAWEMTELNCDIPYELIILSNRSPSNEARQHAKTLATSLK